MRKFEYRGCFAQVWTQCWDASPEVVAWLKAHNQSNAEAVFELLNVTHSAAAAARGGRRWKGAVQGDDLSPGLDGSESCSE